MSELENRYVYRGVWVNQMEGSSKGRTITVDSKTSTIIVALLAVMSTIGATHLWSLLLFMFHQQRASGQPENALFRQQQALIRASPAPGSFVTEMIKLWWTWRRKGRVLYQCLLPAFFSLLFAASTLTASVFSSAIISSSDIEVLVNSPYCGFRNATRAFSEHTNPFEGDYISTYESLGEAYALDCYTNDSISRSGCNNVFAKPNIPFTARETQCPFSPDMCATKNFSAIVMDSGLLDMNEHFGFNLEVKDRVKFRRQTTCSVLPSQGYFMVLNASDISYEEKVYYMPEPIYYFPEEQFVASLYGGLRDSSGKSYFGEGSHLHQVTSLRSLFTTNSSQGYALQGKISSEVNRLFCKEDQFCWTPIPEIAQDKADLVLITITMGKIQYREPVEDPLFAAHTIYNTTGGIFYYPDHTFGALGCTIQYQVCISQGGKNDSCTELGPLSLDAWQTAFADATSIQKLILQLLGHSSMFMDFSNVFNLNATYTLNRGQRTNLPDDQWKVEAISQESKVWAILQILLVDYAIGAQATEPHAYEYVDKPVTAAEKSVCHTMRMKKSGGFANINVIGLSVTIGLSCTLMILDLILLKSLPHVPFFRRKLAPRIDRWIQDSVFQFQRRAYEAHGSGEWENLNEQIPNTTDMEKLSELPVDSVPQPVTTSIVTSTEAAESVAKVAPQAAEEEIQTGLSSSGNDSVTLGNGTSRIPRRHST